MRVFRIIFAWAPKSQPIEKVCLERDITDVFFVLETSPALKMFISREAAYWWQGFGVFLGDVPSS